MDHYYSRIAYRWMKSTKLSYWLLTDPAALSHARSPLLILQMLTFLNKLSFINVCRLTSLILNNIFLLSVHLASRMISSSFFLNLFFIYLGSNINIYFLIIFIIIFFIIINISFKYLLFLLYYFYFIALISLTPLIIISIIIFIINK